MDKIYIVCEWSLFFILICLSIIVICALILITKQMIGYVLDNLIPKSNSNSATEIYSQYGVINRFIDLAYHEQKTTKCKGSQVSFLKKRVQLVGQELKIKASIDGYFSIDQKSDTDKKEKLDEIFLDIIDFYMQKAAFSIINNSVNHADKQKLIDLCTDLKNELDNISGKPEVIEIHRAIQNYLSKHSNADMEIDKELNEYITKINAEVEKTK